MKFCFYIPLIYSIIIPIINRFCSCIFMNKLKTLFLSILIGSFAGAIASFAFSSPGSNQPPNGNPIFWLLSGTSMYYTAGNVGIGTSTPATLFSVATTTNILNVLSSGNIGIGTANPAATLDVSGTGSMKMPVGTTAQRPSTPAIGMMRFNTDTSKVEFYNGATWFGISGVSATGGTVADIGGYRIHTFTTSGTFTVTAGGNIEILMVAGGGGGGGGHYAGGGGGGGVIYNSIYAVSNQSYTVTVGTGGSGGIGGSTSGGNGGNSIFGALTAIGGGGGGSNYTQAPSSGGSGGGGPIAGGGDNGGQNGAAGTTGQGNSGGNAGSNAGGGGGAGEAGVSGGGSAPYGRGGNGLTYNISGTLTYYGGGGGGAWDANNGTPALVYGGLGGGGTAGTYTTAATAGTPNTGGGGGGGEHASYSAGYNGAAGGSGIVIIRYQI